MHICYVIHVFSDAKYFLGIIFRQTFEETLNKFQLSRFQYLLFEKIEF